MSMNIAFLACSATLPGSVGRRIDAFEHDLQVAALRPSLQVQGAELVEIDWRAPIDEFQHFDAFIIGTTWDYQDHRDDFIRELAEIEGRGLNLFNSTSLVSWNTDKIYLQELASKGARTIPTKWSDLPMQTDIDHAFRDFQSDRLVVKRRVGAGAEGQMLVDRSAPEFKSPLMNRPAMIQPFLPSILAEGEYSFIFIDGAYSHALLKTSAQGDYRIQSAYGGREQKVKPSTKDLDAAATILTLLPEQKPLYARIDMVRGDDGTLMLMEAELIEPFLYPLQGPELGERLASALIKRLT